MYFKNKLPFIAAFLLSPMIALAQQAPSVGPDASSIPVGPFDLTPSVELEYIDDDNITADALSPISSKLTVVSPGFSLRFDDGLSGVSLNYLLQDASYSNNDNGDNDYTDQFIDLAAGTIIAEIHRVEISAEFIESHDPRDSSPSGNLLDEYEDESLGLSYTLGLGDSPFSFRASIENFERRYQSNLSLTRPFDRDEEILSFDILYDLSADILLSLELSDTDIEYINDPDRDDPVFSRDGTEEFFGIGVDWDINEAIDLQLLVGETERDLSVGSRGGFSGSFWDASLEWSPLSYSTVTLDVSRYTDEDNTQQRSDFTVRRDTGITWVHYWFDNFATEISYSDQSVDYSSSPRKDDFDEYEIRLQYQFRRWVGFDVFYRDAERTSNISNGLGQNIFDYTQGVFGISALFNL
jgi:hypothetical protein